MKRIAAVVLALCIGGGAAYAAKEGMGHRGGHGPFGFLSEKVHQQLSLTAEQEAGWQSLMKERDTMHQQMRDAHANTHDLVTAELKKAQPDFAAVIAAMDATHDQGNAARKAFAQDALKFYNGLTPERQAIIVNEMRTRLAKMDAMRQHHKDHMGQ